MPYFDYVIRDVAAILNAPIDGQRQYVSVVLDEEHMEFKEGEMNEELKTVFKQSKDLVSDYRILTLTNKNVESSFRIKPSDGPIIYHYHTTLNSFYKAFSWAYRITGIGVAALALFLVIMSLLMPLKTYMNYLVVTAPILTTLVLLILSSYLILPKDKPLNIGLTRVMALTDTSLVLVLTILINY